MAEDAQPPAPTPKQEMLPDRPPPPSPDSPREPLLRRLDRAWAAKPQSYAGLRWSVRMQRTHSWNFWAGIALLALFVAVPAAVLALSGVDPEERPLDLIEPGVLEWFLYGWPLLLALTLLAGLLLMRRASLFDLGFTGCHTLPRQYRSASDSPPSTPRTALRDLRFTVLFALVLALVYASLGVLLYLLDPHFVENVLTEKKLALLLIITLVVIAPIGEEILFRGVLYPIFRREYGPFLGALLNAVVFALMHASFAGSLSAENLNHFFGGLVFCYAYERTGSIWPAIALHLLGNTSLVVLNVLPLDSVTELLQTLLG